MIDQDFIARQQVIRRAILEVLYGKRKQGGAGYIRDLTHTLGHAPDESAFALGYLAEAGMVIRESVHCRITARAINYVETEV